MKKPIVMLAFALGLVGLYFFLARRASAAPADAGAANGATGATGALGALGALPAGGSSGLPPGGIAFEGGMPPTNYKAPAAAPAAAPTAAPTEAPSGGSAPRAIGGAGGYTRIRERRSQMV